MTIFIIGTRPEAIKLAPLILNFKKNNVDHIVCSSGQHADMIVNVLDLFNIQIDVDFRIMKKNQTLSYITYAIIQKLEEMFSSNKKIKNVIIHGDTSTSLAAAIWAFQNKLNIIHIESGLRTLSIDSPFPEEANRRCISQLAKFSFCPTNWNKDNLIRENNKSNIYVVGNTVIDAVNFIINNKIDFKEKNNIEKYAVLTTHRCENIGHNMENIFKACNKIAHEKNIIFYFPMHPNPKIKEIFDKTADKKFYKILKPQRYDDFIKILSNSLFVMTDSGGIQEECMYLKIPLFILRDETERKEIIDLKNISLVGTNENEIKNIVCEKLLYNVDYDNKIYGDGTTSIQILDILKKNKII